ncbi:MAG TPA: SDR family NAD(P)-dependent oxidoreductase [Acidimicrobiia bacterium]|nr:SDR family NAD(P)-dependent oxidoreductase [Acidimicrobiia bacterium]
MEIAGNVALVTGAASGLGEATARRLHAAGAQVVLADVAEERGRKVAAELGNTATFVHCDVTAEPAVAAAVETAAALGRFAMCVHCGGGGIAARTLSRDGTPHDLDAFRKVVELNLIGSFNVLRLAAAGMAGNRPDDGGERGACVLTASIAGYEGQIGQIAYGSAKAGVIGMTIIAARDLSSVGVRVCTIAPGTIATPPMLMVPQAMRDAFAANVPFPKRLGEPDEYAALAQHILENSYLNGEVIRLDGAVRFQPK